MSDHPVTSLRISTDPLSFGRTVLVHDARGELAYEAHRVSGIVQPGWELHRSGHRLAEMSWAPGFSPRWRVSTPSDTYEISQRVLSIARVFDIEGGHFAGASLRGSLLDRTFELTWRDVVFARATSPLIALLDEHWLGVYSPQEDVEQLALMSMLAVHAEHLSKGQLDHVDDED